MTELTRDIGEDLTSYNAALRQWLNPTAVEDSLRLRRLQQHIHRRLRESVDAPANAHVIAAPSGDLSIFLMPKPGDRRRVCTFSAEELTVVYRPNDNAVYFQWRPCRASASPPNA